MTVIQIAQHADDLPRATRFYTELLEQPPTATYDPPGLVFFVLDGLRLLLERGAPSALHYFGVADLDATIERFRAGGTVIDSEPHLIFRHEDATLGPSDTEEWQAFLRDSEGNLVGLVEHRRA